MRGFTLISLVIFIATGSLAKDLGFRYQDGECKNSNGEKGYNPDYWGQCGDFSNKEISNFENPGLDLSGSKFIGATLTDVKISDANLTGTEFDRAKLNRIDFYGATLDRSHWVGTEMRKVILSDSKASDAVMIVKCLLCDWNFAKLSGSKIQQSEFVESSLEEIDVSGGSIGATKFIKSDLQGAKLRKTHALEVVFDRTSIDESIFDGADLEGAVFIELRAKKVSFKDANLLSAAMIGSQIDLSVFDGAIFKDADLSYSRWAKTSAKKVFFNDAGLGAMKTSDCDLTESVLEGALVTKGTQLGLSRDELDRKGAKYQDRFGRQLFYDRAYVDRIEDDPSSEAWVVRRLLFKNKRAHVPLEGLRYEVWQEALLDAKVLIIPEQEKQSLGIAISKEMEKLIEKSVRDGMRLVVFGSRDRFGIRFLESVFRVGFRGYATPRSMKVFKRLGRGQFRGSLFEGLETKSLPRSKKEGYTVMNALERKYLPKGSKVLYGNDELAVLAEIPFGKGKVVYLGWDYNFGYPEGPNDGGWSEVVDRAVQTE